MSRASDKETNLSPDRIRTYDLSQTGRMLPYTVGYFRTSVGWFRTPVGYFLTLVGYFRTPVGYLRTPVGYFRTPFGYFRTLVGYLRTPVRHFRKLAGCSSCERLVANLATIILVASHLKSSLLLIQLTGYNWETESFVNPAPVILLTGFFFLI